MDKADIEVRSSASRSSKCSATSSVLLGAATVRAKAEAAHTRAESAKKELEIKLEGAMIRSNASGIGKRR